MFRTENNRNQQHFLGRIKRYLAKRFFVHALSVVFTGIFFLPCCQSQSSAGAAATITIADRVVTSAPERFGVNIAEGDKAGGLFNSWTMDAGMEPVVLRYKGIATSGGDSFIINNENPTTSVYNTIGKGFFDRAQVRVYRMESDSIHLVRTGMVSRYEVSPSFRITLTENGSPVKKGDIYFLSMIRDNVPFSLIDPRMKWLEHWDTWSITPTDKPVTKVRVADTPPENGGRTSMQVRIADSTRGGICQFSTGSPDSGYPSYTPGARYTTEIWIKQQGIADGSVLFKINTYPEKIEHVFTVSDAWKKYSFTFTGPAYLSSGSAISTVGLYFTGPGTLWVDNFRIYDEAQPPYALKPEVLKALKDYQPGTLRIWSGQTNTEWGTSLDNWLLPEGRILRTWNANNGPTGGPFLTLPVALKTAKETGASPWLIVHPSFSEQEWLNLIEYLAGTDTTPYGALRLASGQPRPWTDEFDHIRIELGNETWNNLFAPWSFSFNGQLYGRFAEYFFSIAKASPFFPKGKIDFAVGGFLLHTHENGYGQSAIKACQPATLMGVTGYTDGWDMGGGISGDTDDEKFQNVLLNLPWVMSWYADRHAAVRDGLAREGHPFSLAVYEGGPGYSLPDRKKPFNPEEEKFGKSLASGVAALDTFLYNTSKGYGPQSFFLFRTGYRWSSHTIFSRGYRPHACWLALQLRNRYCPGDMVQTTVKNAPSVRLPACKNFGVSIPEHAGELIGAYAFKDRNRYAVAVVSRELHRSLPVKLVFPVSPKPQGHLYKLTGNPRQSNIDGININIIHEAIGDLKKEYGFTLPPGSIYVFNAEY